jgi:hypothetical protein
VVGLFLGVVTIGRIAARLCKQDRHIQDGLTTEWVDRSPAKILGNGVRAHPSTSQKTWFTILST